MRAHPLLNKTITNISLSQACLDGRAASALSRTCTPIDPKVKNPANPNAPAGSVKLGLDGSSAAFVPARRAMTWQLTDAAGKAVVRERNWLTFQPGEIRTCVSCHGLNSKDQAGGFAPLNKPEALRTLMRHWKQLPK